MIQPVVKINNLILAVILVIALLTYGNTIRNSYSLDDTYVTQNNPKVMKGIAGIPEIFTSRYVDEEGNSFGYRPIAVATFAIEHELWGQNPHMSHLINAMLFALCSMLLFTALRKVFRNSGWLFTLVITLLFIAHPIHTEAVASLKNRETLLSFLLGLVALHCFLKWMESKKLWLIFAGTFCFILAFLSKQDVITFVAVIPMALYFSHAGNLLMKYAKGSFIMTVKDINPFRFGSLNTWSIPAIFCLFTFIPVYYYVNIPLLTIFTFAAALFFMIISFVKNKPGKGKDRLKIFPLIFLGSGILLHLVLAVNMVIPGFYYKSYFPVVSLCCYAVFFFRILHNIKLPKVILSVKVPVILIPKSWLYLILTVLVLSIVGLAFHKLPDQYLPAQNKVVYNFENPQFVGDTGYQTGPLAFYTLFFYLEKLLWPHPLGFYYGYKMIPEVSWKTPEVIFSLIFHLGILIFALWKLPKKHILSFAILYYLATISVFTNIVIKIPGIVGERLAFFPSLGFCIALAWGLFKLLGISPEAERIPRNKAVGLSFIFLLVLIPYSIKTITRNTHWKDYLTLYSKDIGYLKNSVKANSSYASQLLKEAFNNNQKNPSREIQQEYLNLAVRHLKRAVEIDPDFKFGWNNLGFISMHYRADTREAVDYLQKALSIDTLYGEAHYNLGSAYGIQGDVGKSIFHFRKASVINPEDVSNYLGEAETWFKSGELDSAFTLFLKASQIDSLSELPSIGLGNVSWLQHDTLKAVEFWEKAFSINPDNIVLCRNLFGYYQQLRSPRAEIYRRKISELENR